ncbi:MAG: HNH endonuclease [Campylobacterota bacterium]
MSNITIEERLKIFDEHYTILFSSLDSQDKIYIGKEDNLTCRFCGKNKDEVTFNDIAHAIPEAIGNKKIILNEECDECNKLFSENIEVHFDKVTKPWRNIGQIKGKKKIPSYKTKDKKSRIDVKDGFKITERLDSRITAFDEIEKQLSVTYELEPYIPQAVYKTFVKMALSVMPHEELKNFKEALQWIQESDHSKTFMNPLKVLTTFIPGPRPNIEPITLLLKRKTDTSQYPYSIFVLAFGNMIYQIVVPSLFGIDKSKKTETTIPKFPSPFEIDYKYGDIKHNIIDWSSYEIVKDEVLPIHLSYETKEEVDIGS